MYMCHNVIKSLAIGGGGGEAWGKGINLQVKSGCILIETFQVKIQNMKKHFWGYFPVCT